MEAGDHPAGDPDLASIVDDTARSSQFSGVVRVDRDGKVAVARAYGLADRRHGVANDVATQFAIASGAKGLTALTVMSLVETGQLALAATARSLLGDDLPLIGASVTIEHLLAHRSGIGDYLDEEAGHAIDDYVMPVPVHQLATSEQFLAAIDGHPASFPPDVRFAYNNGGYVVLAILAERAAAMPFHELVVERVCRPAGMVDTAYLRSDELPGRAATGYLHPDSLRTNVLHLPVRGSGDGGAYSTAADIHALWRALFAGRIVPSELVEAMVAPRSALPSGSHRYGLGFWLAGAGTGVMLEGYDAGVSFRSVHDRDRRVTYTVLANTSEGAWPMARRLAEVLDG